MRRTRERERTPKPVEPRGQRAPVPARVPVPVPVPVPEPSEPRDQPVTRVYGISAALAVLAHRPEQVRNIAYTPSARAHIGEALREAARRRIAYREVSEQELSRMAGSVHHEGVCLLAAELPLPTIDELARRSESSGLLLALDNVGNPHNVGAILRSAAFFGAQGLIVSGLPGRGPLPAAAVRIAAGGAEHVPLARATDLAVALAELAKRGHHIVGADTHAKTPLYDLRWPARAVVVLGSEDVGLSKPVRARCQSLVQIGGSGSVESLNVSVAAGVVLASFAASKGASATARRPQPTS
jgi:RNA methyltransferase, TrmH family